MLTYKWAHIPGKVIYYMKTGLVSVTFRKLTVEQIIPLIKNAGLDGVEWGGDVHVCPGDYKKADYVSGLMEENCLETISYGSYYRVGESDNFDEVLKTAAALRTKNIRVWAGVRNFDPCDNDYFNKVKLESQRIADMAKQKDITISFEYHSGTLTSTQKSTIRLLNEINRDNVYTYWQPNVSSLPEQNLTDIKELIDMGRLKNIHAFVWRTHDRLPFSDGSDIWKKYLNLIKNDNTAVMLEFVRDDSVQQFESDARALKNIICK